MYQINQEKSLLKRGEQFKDIHYGNERDRLTEAFRNSGVFHFSQDYISFENDTLLNGNIVNTEIQIENRQIRNEDSIARVPFKIYKIKV